MPDRCTIVDCSRSSRLFCKCCQEEFCLPHFSEHHERINVQVDQLKSDLNAVQERLKRQQIDRFLNQFRQQMKEWRVDCYTIIDQYFDEKCHEFTRYVDQHLNQQPDEIRQIQEQIESINRSENFQRNQIDLLRSRVNDVNQRINQIETTLATTVFTPLKLNPDAVHIPK